MNTMLKAIHYRNCSFRYCIWSVLAMLALASPYRLLATEEESVSVRFSMLAWKDAIRDLSYLNNGKARPVLITDGALTPFYRYVGTPVMTFFKKEAGADGTMVSVPQAQVTLSREVSQYIFVFFPNEKEEGLPYKVYAVPDTGSTTRGGTYRFFNLARFPIGLIMGKETQVIAPNKNETIEPKPSVGKKNVMLKIAGPDEGRAKQLYSSAWTVRDDRRYLIFITQGNSTEKSIELRRFSQNAAKIADMSRDRG